MWQLGYSFGRIDLHRNSGKLDVSLCLIGCPPAILIFHLVESTSTSDLSGARISFIIVYFTVEDIRLNRNIGRIFSILCSFSTSFSIPPYAKLARPFLKKTGRSRAVEPGNPNKPLTRYFVVIVVIVDFVFCWKVITMSCQMRYGRSIIMYLSRGRGVGQHNGHRSLSIKVCGHLMSPFLYMVPSSHP